MLVTGLPLSASLGHGAWAVSASQGGILLRRKDSHYRCAWRGDTVVHIKIFSTFTF